jgi:hypothetical protein
LPAATCLTPTLRISSSSSALSTLPRRSNSWLISPPAEPMATRLATNERAAGLAATTGATTLRAMNSSSLLAEARTDASCRTSRSTAISAMTSPALRTPRLVSLPPSSVNRRTDPDLTTNTPSAGSPALQTVSPKATMRDCAACARRSMSLRVSAENRSTDARNSTRDAVLSFELVGIDISTDLDHMLLRAFAQPVLAQQAADLAGGVVV